MNSDAAITAPVLPAEAKASTAPCLCAPRPTWIEDRVFVFTAVAAFRSLGGRLADTDVLTAHALYWYFAAIAYSAVWFVVYVTK